MPGAVHVFSCGPHQRDMKINAQSHRPAVTAHKNSLTQLWQALLKHHAAKGGAHHLPATPPKGATPGTLQKLFQALVERQQAKHAGDHFVR